MQIKYEASISQFNNIPGNLFVYWVGKGIFNIYTHFKPLKDICEPKQGIAASGNDLFLRRWFEVCENRTCLISEKTYDYVAATNNYRWFPYSKGGEYRKWFGNEEYVINYQYNGRDIWNHEGAVVRNPSYYFRECISWSDISSSKISFKYKDFGHIFDAAGPSIFYNNDKNFYYTFGLLNTKVIEIIAEFMSPALHFSVGQVAEYPFIDTNEEDKNSVKALVVHNIELSKRDWDSFETSWDFKKHPLI